MNDERIHEGRDNNNGTWSTAILTIVLTIVVAIYSAIDWVIYKLTGKHL